ncbi:MAG: hypothetical protein MSG64_06440 [Pyrinomonadaceae bacterium MAG19_C2-C3]|nr:hypothetical protein [Pyrinomonadaceae bacterium MAG19_C2-C3]
MEDRRKVVMEIPVNKRAYRLAQADDGTLRSITGAAYKRLADGSVRRISGKMNKHLRKKHGLGQFTNAQVEQAVNDARQSQQTSA